MMTVVGYVRRSKAAGARTVSLEEQTARIEAYSAEQAWALTEVVIDDGVSGGRRERLVRLEAAVRTHRAAGVEVPDAAERWGDVVRILLEAARAGELDEEEGEETPGPGGAAGAEGREERR